MLIKKLKKAYYTAQALTRGTLWVTGEVLLYIYRKAMNKPKPKGGKNG